MRCAFFLQLQCAFEHKLYFESALVKFFSLCDSLPDVGEQREKALTFGVKRSIGHHEEGDVRRADLVGFVLVAVDTNATVVFHVDKRESGRVVASLTVVQKFQLDSFQLFLNLFVKRRLQHHLQLF